MTAQHELVWEYISPYKGKHLPMNMIYRAYSVPYEWVPQEDKPAETPVEPLDVKTFRVPGAAPFGDRRGEVEVEGGTLAFQPSNALCVAAAGEEFDE